jgi:hypothetical protein
MSRTFRAKDSYYTCEESFKATMDKKRWSKPPKWFKRMRRQVERARTKDAMRHILDDIETTNIPIIKHSDIFNWN